MNKSSLQQHTDRGAALLIFVIIFLLATATFVYAISAAAYEDIVRYRTLEHAKGSLFGAEAGIEDAIYRHRNTMTYSPNETFSFNGVTVDVVRTISAGPVYHITSTADMVGAYRRVYLEMFIGSGTSFSYGLQSDTGGILMENTSSVLGNIYSNGTVIGTGGGDGNVVSGTVISAGAGGYVAGVDVGGQVYSHFIGSSTIAGDAYCEIIKESNVSGDLYCNDVQANIPQYADFPGPAEDQPPSIMPFTDSDIEDLKTDASVSIIASTDPECASGTYIIDSDTTLGPVKIECNVEIQKASTELTLTGVIWIEGNFETKNGPTVSIDSSLEGKAIAIIADNEADRVTSSKIILNNTAVFNGYGDGSYIVLISQNEDEELGGPEVAINTKQSSTGDILLYAKHGEILIEQSGNFVGVAALLIRLQNSAQIIYQTGAVSLEFPDGPSGGFVIDTWQEIE